MFNRKINLRATPNGVYTTSNTIAVNRNFKNNEGKYDTDFINIIAWRNTAQFLGNYAKKGSLIGIDGKIQTRNYENQDGQKVYVTEVLVEQVDLLESKKQESETPKEEPQKDPFAEYGDSISIDDNFLD